MLFGFLATGIIALAWIRCRRMSRIMFKNQFYFCRHGESEANVANIVSSFQIGRVEHGLTALGREQVRTECLAMLDITSPQAAINTTIVCSPFLRTKQTAEVISKTIQYPHIIQVAEDLKERYFGDFEGKPANESYALAWQEDELYTEQSKFKCESVENVYERTMALILELDDRFPQGGHRFLLVSHGDAIQITRSRVQGLDPRLHRKQEHVAPGKIIKI